MRALIVCALALVAAAPSQRSGVPRVRSATGEALDRYTRTPESAIAPLMLVGGFNTDQADVWINGGGSANITRRRLIAVTVALEYTAARPTLSPSLIEWAARQVKEYPVPASERLWLRASIALIEGREAWTLLGGSTSHLSNARARFPDDPHFKMAEVVEAEARAGEPPQPTRSGSGGRVLLAFDRLAADEIGPTGGRTGSRADILESAVRRLEALSADERVSDEAQLRLGYIHLRLGRRDTALGHLDRLKDASEPFTRYLGRLFAGWALARENRVDEAIAAYRAALAVVPRARSATTLLTALLVTNDQLDEAEALADGFLASANLPDDPWRGYAHGDYRLYRELIRKLREAMR